MTSKTQAKAWVFCWKKYMESSNTWKDQNMESWAGPVQRKKNLNFVKSIKYLLPEPVTRAEKNGRSSRASASKTPIADPLIEFWCGFVQTPSRCQLPVGTFPGAPILLLCSAHCSRSLRASDLAVLVSTWTLQRDCIMWWNRVVSLGEHHFNGIENDSKRNRPRSTLSMRQLRRQGLSDALLLYRVTRALQLQYDSPELYSSVTCDQDWTK